MQCLSERSGGLVNHVVPLPVFVFRVLRVGDLERRSTGSFVKNMAASPHVTSERTCTNGKQKIGQLETFGAKRTFTMFITNIHKK